jgi:hypothetical protein
VSTPNPKWIARVHCEGVDCAITMDVPMTTPGIRWEALVRQRGWAVSNHRPLCPTCKPGRAGEALDVLTALALLREIEEGATWRDACNTVGAHWSGSLPTRVRAIVKAAKLTHQEGK